MNLLKEISEITLGLENPEVPENMYRLRKSARALLFNAKGEVALQFLEAYNFHKLPGGAIESNESKHEALQRELLEEVGCTVEIGDELGVVIEYCNTGKLVHISYAYIVKVRDFVQNPTLEENEIEEKQKTVWLHPIEALEQMSKDIPQKFEGLFIKEREIAFIKQFLKIQKG